MNWLNPPERIRRFTAHQIGQHALAIGIGGVLLGTAVLLSVKRGGSRAADFHVIVGLAASTLFAYHIAALIVIGIRSDITVGQIACFPSPGGLRRDAAGGDCASVIGKYSPAERADYFACLIWFLPAAATGAALRWPGRFGIPGPTAFFWVRILHAAFGSAWIIHLLYHHVPGRWLRASAGFRAAIFTGHVPLADAERRPGWVNELVGLGILVPAPSDEVPESLRESAEVRRALEEGNRLAREGRFEEACGRFEEALRLYPEYSQARFNLAVARMKQGRREVAECEFRRFLADDPFNPMADQARRLLDAELRREERGDS